MHSGALTDEQWQRVKPLLPGKEGDRGRTAADNRLFLEAVFWMARTGAPWRNLDTRFGKWNSVYQRCRRWGRKGVFEEVFEVLSEYPDFDYTLVDGSIVPRHPEGGRAKAGLLVRPTPEDAAQASAAG